MLNIRPKGKKHMYFFITLFILGLFVIPPARGGETIFAYNSHNLGRVFEQMVQLPEEKQGLFGPIGSEYRDYYLRIF